MKLKYRIIPLLKSSVVYLVLQVNEFHYTSECNRVYPNWFGRCEDVYRHDLADIPDDERARLLLQCLESAENKRLKYVVHPRTILDLK